MFIYIQEIIIGVCFITEDHWGAFTKCGGQTWDKN